MTVFLRQAQAAELEAAAPDTDPTLNSNRPMTVRQ
jgi:hypothetical protein